jgi:3,5-epimerase/4-reductase
MKILIFGKGYIAHKFLDYFAELAEAGEGEYDVEISDVRIEDYSAVKVELERTRPDVVLNCAGKTGRPNVDWCEDNKMETMFGNVVAPMILARACEELDLYMVHVGSGCVYTGDKDGCGFAEDDEPNFDGSFYSRTKAWSEGMMREFSILQLRLRMPLDGKPGPRNFITKITNYEKVVSVPNSLSVLDDFLEAAVALIDRRATGVYNMTNPGIIDHEEILEMYKEIVDPDFEYELIGLDELERVTKAGRSNCGLASRKLEAEGIRMRPVREAVRDVFVQYKANLAEYQK